MSEQCAEREATTPPPMTRPLRFINHTPSTYIAASDITETSLHSTNNRQKVNDYKSDATSTTSITNKSNDALSSTTRSTDPGSNILADYNPYASEADTTRSHITAASAADNQHTSSSTSTARQDNGDSFARGLLETRHKAELLQVTARQNQEVRDLAENVQAYGQTQAEALATGRTATAQHGTGDVGRSKWLRTVKIFAIALGIALAAAGTAFGIATMYILVCRHINGADLNRELFFQDLRLIVQSFWDLASWVRAKIGL